MRNKRHIASGQSDVFREEQVAAKPFETRADIEAYFDCEKITCLLCGRQMAAMSSHLNRTHSMSSDDYRIRFGIPFTYGLAGKTFRAQSASRIREMIKDGRLHVPSSGHRPEWLKPGPRRSPAQAIRVENLEKIRRLNGFKEPWNHAHFVEFVRRVGEGRTVTSVGQDADMPAAQTFRKYLHRHDDLKTEYEKVRAALPISDQVRLRWAGSDNGISVSNLRSQGLTWSQISDHLGVKVGTLRAIWRRFRPIGEASASEE